MICKEDGGQVRVGFLLKLLPNKSWAKSIFVMLTFSLCTSSHENVPLPKLDYYTPNEIVISKTQSLRKTNIGQHQQGQLIHQEPGIKVHMFHFASKLVCFIECQQLNPLNR